MENLLIKKLVRYRTIAMVITLLGIALITYMITVEGELGLLPLVFLVIGVSSSIYFQLQVNKHKTKF